MSQNYYGGGGGFVADSPGYGTQGSPGGSAKRAGGQTIRPVTSLMLNRIDQAHTDAEWTLDGYEVGAVTLVGHVVKINLAETNGTYVVEDGFGSFECRRWVESNHEEDNAKWGHVKENEIVRISGSMKAFGNKRYLNLQSVRPLKDKHEMFYHMLEVAYVKVALERGHPNTHKGQPNGRPDPATAGASAYTSQPAATSANSSSANNGQWAHLPELERRIIDYLLANPGDGETGVHVGGIARAVGGHAVDISNALDRLMDDGHVYTTMDESHFTLSL